MPTERVALPKVWISPESRDGWEQFCATYGVTRSGLVEAIGLTLVDVVAGTLAGTAPLTRITMAVVERAKAVDQERRRRL